MVDNSSPLALLLVSFFQCSKVLAPICSSQLTKLFYSPYTDDMTVSVQLYDGKPMSASVPQRVTCEVVEAQVPMKGIAATPQYVYLVVNLQ